MAISLAKGASVSLSNEAGGTGLRSVTVGLGWDVGSDVPPYDLDLSAVLTSSAGVALSDAHFVFYGNKTSPDGAVVGGEDNRDGTGDGDDETLFIDLERVSPSVQSVAVIASIDQASERGHSFGRVSNAYIRVVNNADGKELARFDLTDGADGDIALVFGELYRDGADWKFQAIGDGYPGGLASAIGAYGIAAG